MMMILSRLGWQWSGRHQRCFFVLSRGRCCHRKVFRTTQWRETSVPRAFLICFTHLCLSYLAQLRHDFVINAVFFVVVVVFSLSSSSTVLQRAALAEKELSILKEQFERQASENKARLGQVVSPDQANEAPPSLPNMDTPLDVMGRPSLLELAAKEKEVSELASLTFSFLSLCVAFVIWPVARASPPPPTPPLPRHLADVPLLRVSKALRLTR